MYPKLSVASKTPLNALRYLLLLAAVIGQYGISDAAGPACPSYSAPARTVPGTLSPQLFGTQLLFNQATDALRSTPDFIKSLSDMHIRSVRFPGGTIGDNYLWAEKKTAREDWFPYKHAASPNDLDFDEFMQVAKCLKAEPTIVINLRYWIAADKIEEGLRQAEAWVRYSNVERGYGVKYWEFGNEVYFKGTQAQSPIMSEEYGRLYGELRGRLKKIDPAVDLGLVLPNRPRHTAPGDSKPWWRGAIGAAGGNIDFIVLHNYPAPLTGQLEAEGSGIGETLKTLKRRLRKIAGKDIPIHLTEWNIRSKFADGPSNVRHDTAGHVQFVADAILDMADSGIAAANYWPLIARGQQGLLVSSSSSLAAAGQTMQLLGQVAGWRIDAGKTSNDKGLSLHVFSDGGKGHAAVVINRANAERELDYPKLIGKCNAAVSTLAPALTKKGPAPVMQKVRRETRDTADAQTVLLPVHSVSLVKCQ